jgi:ATP-dependent Lhr-like helicase
MRFLFAWQHVTPATQLSGVDGLRAVVAQLDGYELAARAWERHVLPARMDRYQPSMLDMLCLTGEVGWGRLIAAPPLDKQPSSDGSGRAPARTPKTVVAATPMALFLREHIHFWRLLTNDVRTDVPADGTAVDGCSASAGRVYEALRSRGASFARELAGLLADESALLAALGELAAAGLVTSDGFAGLRAIIRAASGRWPVRRAAAQAGRWSLTGTLEPPVHREAAVEAQAWALLRRYGVVFRRVLAREANAAPWRDLARVLRRLEMRGEIRGGRFVAGMSGEQFALPDAVERLREVRRTPPDDRLIVISAADPLNLSGIITAGERVRAVAGVSIGYRNGVPADLPARPADRLPRSTPAWAAQPPEPRSREYNDRG